mmetsp:Transcript_61727/g.172429  ORF Transcript_61727/g.172429 Transcript_61727/m.172429 type:complete len:217 (-) Transcript_61727:1477-2127(-)
MFTAHRVYFQCNEAASPPSMLRFIEQAPAALQQDLQPRSFAFRTHQVLAPYCMFDLAVVHCRRARGQYLHGAEAAELHHLAHLHASRRLVVRVDDIPAHSLTPLPALLLTNQPLYLGHLRVDGSQRLGNGTRRVGGHALVVLNATAHLAEAKALHCLFCVVVLGAAANDHRGPGKPTKCGLKDRREHILSEGHRRGRPPVRRAELPLLQRGDAALQ